MQQRECALYCGHPITDAQRDEAYIEQTVFVHGPKKNGATLATDTGRLAHKECVERALVGIAPDQDSLFEAVTEADTDHARMHGVFGAMQPHDELHGTGPGQHTHTGSILHQAHNEPGQVLPPTGVTHLPNSPTIGVPVVE